MLALPQDLKGNHKKTDMLRYHRKGGWESAASALTVSKCKNFDPFFQWNMTLWYSEHILSHCKGSQKCIFNAFNAPLYRYPTVLWQSSSGSKEEVGILVVGWKWLFCSKIHFRIQNYNISSLVQKYTKKRNHKKLTVREGGSTFTVSLTVKYSSFYDFPEAGYTKTDILRSGWP